MDDELKAKVDSIFSRIMNIPTEHAVDLKRQDLPGWDSLRHAELIVKIQSVFKIRFSVKEALDLQSLVQLRELTHKKVNDLKK